MRLMQALAILVPFLVAGVILAVRWRKGSATLGPPLLLGLPFLAVGGLFWFILSGNTETDLPWTWIVGVLLGIIAITAVINTGRAAFALLVTAMTFPVIAVAIIGWDGHAWTQETALPPPPTGPQPATGRLGPPGFAHESPHADPEGFASPSDPNAGL